MANYGTSPGAVLVPGTNVFMTGSSVGAVAGTSSTGALGSMVNCSSTANPTGATTGNQGYLNCDPISGAIRQTITASPSGGATAYPPFVPLASDNHQTVKNGSGTVFWVAASNNSATKNYARLYDAGTGFNGCNSATGILFAFEIPPTDSGFSIPLGGASGLAFSTGLSICVTSGFGLTDVTAATATAIYFNVGYK